MKYFIVESQDYGNPDCGHKHRTREAAERCRSKLTASFCSLCGKPARGVFGMNCKCWSPSFTAKWYNSKIVEKEI
jgi:hypothetical protein